MNMTRKEATRILQNGSWWDCLPDDMSDADMNPLQDALDVALSALRPITREQVEKVWKGCPECKPRCGLCAHIFECDKYGKPYVCESCVDFSNFESDQQFCEVCGAPMTDEAVDMVMERLEALRDE